VATLASLRQQAQAVEVAEPSEPLQTDAEILLGFAQTCKATTLAPLNGSSEGKKTNIAAQQVGQPTTAHSGRLAIQEHSAPSFVEAVPLTRDLVNVIPPCRPEGSKQARFHEPSKTAVPRFLSPGSKALTGQAVPHLSHDHADSAAAASDNIPIMRKKHISKQAAHPGAIPNSSETQPTISNVNWKRLLPESPAETGHPLLDAAMCLNNSNDDCIIAKINDENSRIAAASHKLPSGVLYPAFFQQLFKTDRDRVASTGSTLKQLQTDFSLNKESFRDVLNQPQEPACKASEQASNINPSKGPVAQGNGSSAAVGGSSTPSAPPSGEHSHNFSLSHLF